MKTRNIRNWLNLCGGLLIGLLVLFAAGCTTLNFTPSTGEQNKKLVPDAHVQAVEEPGLIEIELGLVNTSEDPIPVLADFEGQWVLLHSSGDVRARGEVLTAGPLEPQERDYQLIWSGQLDSDTYSLKWGEDTIGTVLVEFQVMQDGTSVEIDTTNKQTSEEFLIKPSSQNKE